MRRWTLVYWGQLWNYSLWRQSRQLNIKKCTGEVFDCRIKRFFLIICDANHLSNVDVHKSVRFKHSQISVLGIILCVTITGAFIVTWYYNLLKYTWLCFLHGHTLEFSNLIKNILGGLTGWNNSDLARNVNC